MILDLVCKMPVEQEHARRVVHDGVEYFFCSELCARRFSETPKAFLSSEQHSAARTIAFVSMEIAVHPRVPTYSGGLGVLAGDILQSCADLGVPIVAVTLLPRRGYLTQVLDEQGHQRELPAQWDPRATLRELPVTCELFIEGRSVRVGAWQRDLRGRGGYVVPVYFLDTDRPENDPRDRALSGELYGGDARYRLGQEILLSVGARRILWALGLRSVHKLHLNEGHAALAAWSLCRELAGDFEATRERCIFTTHTPIEAGRDRFGLDLVAQMLDPEPVDEVLRMLGGAAELDMTALAVNLSGFVNGVAIRHRDVTAAMFPGYAIHHITNGVHSATWTSAPMRALFDARIPGWQDDPGMLRHALRLDDEELAQAHAQAKAALIELIEARTGRRLDPGVLLLGFGRRATAYKRADLVLSDLARLEAIAARAGGLQIAFGGKAHPRDEDGKKLIERVVQASQRLTGSARVVYVPDYDIDAAAAFVAGADVWLNTPLPPMEASGTSGMKAAHNGVPSLSVLDGWWLEGCIEDATGWAIADASDLYAKLEARVLPAFHDRGRWAAIMKHAIALNASYFNTHRVVQQYAARAYLKPVERLAERG